MLIAACASAAAKEIAGSTNGANRQERLDGCIRALRGELVDSARLHFVAPFVNPQKYGKKPRNDLPSLHCRTVSTAKVLPASDHYFAGFQQREFGRAHQIP